MQRITHWQEDQEFQRLCLHNYLKIMPLDRSHIANLRKMLEDNSEVDGFVQMDPDTINGYNIQTILNEKNSIAGECGRCMVAVDPRNNSLLGFIIVKRSEDQECAISELGVDSRYSFNNRKSGDPQNIGKALLLAGCNELLAGVDQTPLNIGVLASNDQAEQYYKKFYFIRIPGSDDPDGEGADAELALNFQDYSKLVKDITAALHKPIANVSNDASKESGAPKSGFFATQRRPSVQAGEERAGITLGRGRNPANNK